MNPLSLDGIHKSFGGRKILQDVSLSLKPGTITGLLGNNGAGKTTLMQIGLGLVGCDDGSVELFGEPVDCSTALTRQRVGYVPQTMDSFKWMTAKQALQYVGVFYKNWDKQLIDRLIESWEVPGSSRVSALSWGERQKLSVLLALGHRPDLLILDEPVASLDPGSRRKFLQEIVAMNNRDGQTIFFSTHILSDLERVAEDVLILHRGQLRYAGSLDDLKERVVRIESRVQLDANDPLIADHIVNSKMAGQQFHLIVRDWDEELTVALQNKTGAKVDVRNLGLEEIYLELTA